jgi:hypothetical protein
MADRRVLGTPGGRLDRTHHDFAGVHADADLDRRQAALAQGGGVAAEVILHPQGRIQRALRMVFVCERRAEHREDAVTGRLHNVAVIASDRRDHQLEGGIDDRAGFLGVEILRQFGGALDIGE